MDYFETFKNNLPIIITIIGVGLILFLLVTLLFRFLERKFKTSIYDTQIKLIHRIVKGIIILAVLVSLASFFTRTRSEDQILTQNFNLLFRISIIGLITIILATISRSFFTNIIERMERREKDTTKYQFFRSIIEVSIYALGLITILLAIPGMRTYATTLLGGAGILALIVGFAAQETFSNILAGILITLSKPFRLGDTVEVSNGMMGTVWDISLRHTIIKDYDNKLIVIPNSVMNKEKLFNYTLGDERSCERIEIGISYDSDPDLARKIMEEEVAKHPLSIDPRNDYQKDTGVPPVVTRVTALGESSVTIRVWAWARNYGDGYAMKCDLLDSIKKRFDLERIEIPFPQRVVTLKQVNEINDMRKS